VYLHDEDVYILVAGAFHGLLVQHGGQCLDLVAHLGGLFKRQLLCVSQHALLQFV